MNETSSAPKPAGASKAAAVWIAVLFLVMGVTGVALGLRYLRPPEAGSATAIDDEYRRKPASADQPWIKEYELTERSGKKVGSADLAGKVQVVDFFFSSCPQTCFLQNTEFAAVHREYGPKGVQFVSITCDPDVDSPSKLRDYATRFQGVAESWWFLTGELGYVQRVSAEYYEVPLQRFTHVEYFLAIDKWGNRRGKFSWKDSTEIAQMKLLLDQLLKETEPPAEFAEKPAPAEAEAPESSTEDAPSAKPESPQAKPATETP